METNWCQDLKLEPSRCSIDIERSQDCCGCGACAAICTSNCIKMLADAEGFLCPQLDTTCCSGCGLCRKVCPWQTTSIISERVSPPQVHAAWHLDKNIRYLSSSGGVFTAFSEQILSAGGAVVGAAFDEGMVVRHILVEDTDGLARLRGSKYVQSEIPTELFSRIDNLLGQDRRILFSGTPCQVAALRNYLGQDHETLLCCDLICHGVPSPGLFRKHLDSQCKETVPIASFEFRNKKKGWKHFGIKKTWKDASASFESMYEDPFMASFLRNYCLRGSCYGCKFTTTTRQGDITIADYWGVATKYPEYDREDRGTSLLLINTTKGQNLLRKCENELFVGIGDLDHAVTHNPMLSRPASKPPERDTFLRDMSSMTVAALRTKYHLYPPVPRPFWLRVLGFIKRNLCK